MGRSLYFGNISTKEFSFFLRADGRDFGEKRFPSPSNDQTNTMTVVLDTGENIFGEYPPLKWPLRASSNQKANDNLKSFILFAEEFA
jgi:hypothetical protein